jgi:hypothetical protein
MSSAPNGLAPSGQLPTGAVASHPSRSLYVSGHAWPSRVQRSRHSLPHPLSRFTLGGSSPHGYTRPSLPRAAYSHSASLGSRLFTDSQYTFAWLQSTQLTGWS